MAGTPPGDTSVPSLAPGDLTGWERVSRLLGYAFARQETGEEVPPIPEELREWAKDTMTALLAGLVFGGGRKWLVERGAGAPQPPPDAPSKLHAARAIAEANTQRLSRVASASVRGGLHFGGLVAVFCAVQMLSGVYRGRRDFLDAAHGGLAAGAVFGVALHRSVKASSHPLRSLVLGAGLGVSLGIPFGLLQDKLDSMLPQEHRAARMWRQQHTEAVIAGTVQPERPRGDGRQYDVTAVVIQQLEASLSRSPSRQQQLVAQAQQVAQQQEQQQEQQGEGRQWRWWIW